MIQIESEAEIRFPLILVLTGRDFIPQHTAQRPCDGQGVARSPCLNIQQIETVVVGLPAPPMAVQVVTDLSVRVLPRFLCQLMGRLPALRRPSTRSLATQPLWARVLRPGSWRPRETQLYPRTRNRAPVECREGLQGNGRNQAPSCSSGRQPGQDLARTVRGQRADRTRRARRT